MLRRPLAFASLLSLVALAGCGARTLEDAYVAADAGADTKVDAAITIGDAAPTPAGQRLLFEVGYVNYAWGFTFSGAYVNADGEVWGYSYPPSVDAPGPSAPVPRAGMTEAELTGKYAANPKLLTTLSQQELAGAYALVDGAETGSLLAQSSCADAGDVRFVAFRWDATSKTYSPVMLGIIGDLAARNTAPEAAQLMAWLQKTTDFSSIDSCAPTTPFHCAGAGCATVACSKSWQTSSCDGKCVDPTRCDAVEDCARCGAGRTCVLDAAGGVHCAAASCPTGTADCACLGDQVCAGGKAWCKPAGVGFRCARP